MTAFETAAPLLLLVAYATAGLQPARADVKSSTARVFAEMVLRRFAGKATAEGAEALAEKIAASAARHGDDLVRVAVGNVGPKALGLADEAAEISPTLGRAALRFIGRHGGDGAALLTKSGMKLLSCGDDAAELLIKHRGVAGPLVESLWPPAVQALAAVGPRNGRRIAMMAGGGELAAMGRPDEVMGVMAKYGDPACDFIYRNKAALAVGATLAAFLSDPEPFIDGARSLSETVVEKAAAPVAVAAVNGGVQLAGRVAEPAAALIPWGPLSVAAVVGASILLAVRAVRNPTSA